MYTLLIVDDEPLVRNAMSTIIDWGTLGFTAIYLAEDGVEALEIARKHKIDLVLTDIVMPFMDGLELSEALKEEFPGIQVVILTGHEEFEYAKQSVDLGVKNYILKPVGASTLYEKMKRICKKIQMETSQKEYITRMKTQIHQSLPVLREKFLYSLVCSDRFPQDAKERILSLELPLNGEKYLVTLVEPDYAKTASSDMELFHFTTQNITMETVGKTHCVFDDNNKRLIIVFGLDEIGEEFHYIIYDTLQVIQKAVYSILKIPVTCSMGMRS